MKRLEVVVVFCVAALIWASGYAFGWANRTPAPQRFEPRECYVDPIGGDDANVGTQAWPFKTWGKAVNWLEQQQSHVGEKRARVSVEAW